MQVRWMGIAAAVTLAVPSVMAATLSYRERIESAATATLSANVSSLDSGSGAVVINGALSVAAAGAFRFAWDDGTTSNAFFPATHTYADRTRNYLVSVTATEPGGATQTAEVVVVFVPHVLPARTFDEGLRVTMPATVPVLATTAGTTVPTGLTAFAVPAATRTVVEFVLSAAAEAENDLVNGDVFRPAGSFQQVLLRRAEFNGALSYWFTTPPMFAAGDAFLQGVPDWSSLLHEMGHNFTLNSPAAFRFGGRIDGNANAIFSEAMAQIFQHVAAHLLVNNAATYGLPESLALEIRTKALASFAVLKTSAARLSSGAAAYASWNDPTTSIDETLPTFMFVAYQFFASGDRDGVNYRLATKRLMFFLQKFNASWMGRYAPTQNTAEASAFRATLMAAAVSYGTGRDLRATFRDRGFPLDDAVWAELNATVGPYPADASRIVNLSVRSGAGGGDKTLTVGFVVTGSGFKQLLLRGVGPTLRDFGVAGALADPRIGLFNGNAAQILANDDWGGGGLLASGFAAVGAFPLAATARDAAVMPLLVPGAYSLQVSSVAGEGVALVEAYDTEGLAGATRLTNVSARTEVGTGDNVLVAGFVIAGAAKRVLIRAIGPALAQFGVGGVLANPQLRLFNGAGQVIEQNDDWTGDRGFVDAFTRAGAFGLPAGSKDAALVVTLPAGSYSAEVSGVDGSTGIGLVEIYELP